MSERQDFMRDFLTAHGWGQAQVAPLPGDASTRRYARLSDGTRRAMLMDQPQDAETPTAPADADEATRRALGYNALARLAGADCARFAAAAQWLRDQGLSAPQILAIDAARGFVILEDLGDALFADVLTHGGDEQSLYAAAADVLARMHMKDAPSYLPPPPSAASRYPLYAYDSAALLAEVDLLTQWFAPLALGRALSDTEVQEHRNLWRMVLDDFQPLRRVFIHRDYHAQNLLWLPDRAGAGRVGLIDFQDAVAGSAAYDLISLTEDARRDVCPQIAEHATRHYLDTMRAQGTPLDEPAFRREMAIMAAQRNAKIVGIFARLYKRDGKPGYLALLPRVWGYLERDLQHPALAGLRAWYDRMIPPDKRVVTL